MKILTKLTIAALLIAAPAPTRCDNEVLVGLLGTSTLLLSVPYVYKFLRTSWNNIFWHNKTYCNWVNEEVVGFEMLYQNFFNSSSSAYTDQAHLKSLSFHNEHPARHCFTRSKRSLAPLHCSLIVVSHDYEVCKNILIELIQRDLVETYLFDRVNYWIHTFAQIKKSIESHPAFHQETIQLEKIKLQQEKIDLAREANDIQRERLDLEKAVTAPSAPIHPLDY